MLSTVIQTCEPNPWFNLALEELIASTLEKDEAALYLWQNQNTVVLGKNQNAWKECRCELLESEGGKLARRSSGGGAVYHDSGNLNFTFTARPELYDKEKQYKVILEACRALGIDAELSGRNDMTCGGRKFSGSAFCNTRDFCIMHGTLLIDADVEKMAKYLQPSPEKLSAKGVSSVRSRVINLSDINPGATVEAMRESIAGAFADNYGKYRVKTLEDFDSKALDKLYARYSSWEWRYGETPRFDAELSTRFSWGGVQLALNMKSGRIAQAKLYSDAMDPDIATVVEGALQGCEYGVRMAERITEAANGNEQLLELAGFLRERA